MAIRILPAHEVNQTTPMPAKPRTKPTTSSKSSTGVEIDLTLTADEILRDYRLAYQSRQLSLIGRREVLSGRAKFGIFGDGKELAQLAMARAFQKGDWRAGYYRDQTLMFALGEHTYHEFFAQLYGHPDLAADRHNAGRQMNAHFATRSVNPDGSWNPLAQMYNSSADLAPTAAQMPRLVGLAHASTLYRELDTLRDLTRFSTQGREIAWGTIGNASCAEGLFWEAVNAIGVLQAPAIISIWDDGYGISVPNEYQVTKGDLSEILAGFQRTPEFPNGYELYRVPGWDYPALVETYLYAAEVTRRDHVPAIIHVVDVTQPQGHSTSGSHERYKSKERLEWEREHDCLRRFRDWILVQGIATPDELNTLEAEEKKAMERVRQEAWAAFRDPMESEKRTVVTMLRSLAATHTDHSAALNQLATDLEAKPTAQRRDIMAAVQQALVAVRHAPTSLPRQQLQAWKQHYREQNRERYNTYLHSHSPLAATRVTAVPATYSEHSPTVNGFEILNAAFDAILARDPRVIAFGEDVGYLGDVNQAFAGLQAKYGKLRVADTGIREATIVGQAIGLAQRGLRPIAEMQYLDYLLYGLQTLSDDLASLHYRTKGGQSAPVIIRTRGHRLEGIFHSGSPMAGIINLVRGMHVLVPRNMTQAAGFYNTLLKSDEPAIVIEVLNGYRLKERLPDNIAEFCLPLGQPETLRPGNDVTLVTYGACVRLALEAAERLAAADIAVEVIDVQSLLPFDLNGHILQSLKKTNRIVFLDEDVPGGASAYMFQQVIEAQGGYYWLDSEPRTLTAQAHRPAYGSDGDYFSKPNVEDIFDTVYTLMHEVNPQRYPLYD